MGGARSQRWKRIIHIFLYKIKQSPYRPNWPRGWIEVSFLDLGTRRGWVVSITPRPLYLRERPGNHCTLYWVGPRPGLDLCEKSHSHRDSIPGPSSP
jgi:hypothetical protein